MYNFWVILPYSAVRRPYASCAHPKGQKGIRVGGSVKSDDICCSIRALNKRNLLKNNPEMVAYWVTNAKLEVVPVGAPRFRNNPTQLPKS